MWWWYCGGGGTAVGVVAVVVVVVVVAVVWANLCVSLSFGTRTARVRGRWCKYREFKLE
jgi:hypothetical protein